MTNEVMSDDDLQRIEREAAVYRRLRDHLAGRGDVQNIDLMNLAGFCRNCLANWYRDAAVETGAEMTKDEAREIVYGMPYDVWRETNHREADAASLKAFERNRPTE
jgi:hypothetical protein